MRLPENPRILIVKLSAVGDVVHALPVLNALREQYPTAYIGWVCQGGVVNLLEGHPQIDELLVLPRRLSQIGGVAGFREIAQRLKGQRGGWDVALDLQGLTKSGVATWLSGAKWRIGFGNQWSRELNRFFMNMRVSPAAYPVVQMNLGLAEAVGVPLGAKAKAVLHTTDADEAMIAGWAQENGFSDTQFLLLDPFAGWETKLWEQEKWVAVAREARARWDLRSLIFHGPGEEVHARELAAAIGAEAAPVIAPTTTLREYVVLLRRHVRAVVAADTGPMHIAAAAGVPVVALFGPSDSHRNAPTFDGARYITLQDFTQPCAKTFARKCPHHPPGKCMSTLQPQQVLDGLTEVMLK